MADCPRLVATDLDGTVLRRDGTMSERTIAALGRVEKAGARLAFVTGRPPRQAGIVLAPFSDQDTVICANGALIYDLRTGKVTEAHLIQAPVLAEAAARLRRAIPGIGIAVEDATGMARDPLFQLGAWDTGNSPPPVTDPQLFARDAAKLLGRHPSLSADELLALASPAIGEIVSVCHSNGPRLVEAMAAGITKGSALAALAGRLGIAAADVVAFGDTVNDLPMLAWAGRSYGVANAHPDVLAMVDRVIPGIAEDGVAQVIENLFPG
ncbi:MAG TPA: HAD family hydrolase [Streptosporangiaceae bacterium]|nr:HAD family hydrolase [Streptosporangiaceae bacterium]